MNNVYLRFKLYVDQEDGIVTVYSHETGEPVISLTLAAAEALSESLAHEAECGRQLAKVD